jgi:hypothetical protein
MEAMKAAAEQYMEVRGERPTQDSVERAWDYVARICASRRVQAKKPYLRDLFYIRAILRNRFSYVNERHALEILENAVLAGADVDALKQHAKTVRNWTQWRTEIEAFIDAQATDAEGNRDR